MVFDHLVVILHPISYRRRTPNVKYEIWQSKQKESKPAYSYESECVDHKQHIHIFQLDWIHFRPLYLMLNLI